MAGKNRLEISGNIVEVGGTVIQISTLTHVFREKVESDSKFRRVLSMIGAALAAVGVAMTQVASFMAVTSPIVDFTNAYWPVPLLLVVLIAGYLIRVKRREKIVLRSAGIEDPIVLVSRNSQLIDAAIDAVKQGMQGHGKGQIAGNITFDFSSGKVIDNSTNASVDASTGKVTIDGNVSGSGHSIGSGNTGSSNNDFL